MAIVFGPVLNLYRTHKHIPIETPKCGIMIESDSIQRHVHSLHKTVLSHLREFGVTYQMFPYLFHLFRLGWLSVVS